MQKARFAGFAQTVGNDGTYKVVTWDNKRVLYRSQLLSPSALFKNKRIDTSKYNFEEPGKAVTATDLIVGDNLPFAVELNDQGDIVLRPDPEPPPDNGEPSPETDRPADDDNSQQPEETETDDVSELEDDTFISSNKQPVTSVNPDDIVGMTYLLPPTKDGERERVTIEEVLEKHHVDRQNNHGVLKLRVRRGEEVWERDEAWSKLIQRIADDQVDPEAGTWPIERIILHDATKRLLVLWKGGAITWNSFQLTKEDAPLEVALYARRNKLLEKRGWKWCNAHLSSLEKASRLVHATKLRSNHHKPFYMHGILVPRNHTQAMQLDKENGNNNWREAEKKEIAQQQEYNTYRDIGKGAKPPPGYQFAPLHFVYAISLKNFVQDDGNKQGILRYKARLVGGGHVTETPVDGTYSSVITLRGVRIVIFLAELNDMQIWATDVGNAYLEARTREKIYTCAGPEFGDLQGHTLLVEAALYGLKSSGLRWHERFADIMTALGFKQSKAENDIWMRKLEEPKPHYEYVAVYVDDLILASHKPEAIIKELTEQHKLKLKGSGPLTNFLGCDYKRDKDGTLCASPTKYLKKLFESYERNFGTRPKPRTSPLE